MYCSLNDIKDELDVDTIIQLLNDEGRELDDIDLTSAADAIVVRANKKIADADTEIDSYLRARYEVPLTSVPDDVVRYSKEISIHNFYLHRRRQQMDEAVVNRYKMIVKELEQVQKGFKALSIAEITAENGIGEFRTNKTSSDKVFTKTILDQY